MSFPRLPFITLCLVLGAGLMTGACALPLAVSGASYAADGGLLVASDKTSTDHMVSMVSKQDCALWRVIKGRAVCKPREGDKDPYKVDYDDPQRTVAEDGVHYAPPLRATADAPATSWDAAAYKATPAPPAAPSAPVTAVAETSPEPTPAVAAAPAKPAAPPAPAKPKKPKPHSVKKPSPRPAAPAS
ncbi:hypothetical protein SAMN02990966_07054 [Rhodospirillales bacterium URHD0017]|nr:hypothetical protein SAMN02990966_07054 [Rhodospirillales bacterium URHD0017]